MRLSFRPGVSLFYCSEKQRDGPSSADAMQCNFNAVGRCVVRRLVRIALKNRTEEEMPPVSDNENASVLDLPQYGHKQWQSYFGRTFDVYTKLWKFQQQHRQVLDNRYGLKRWQIGEIASKIGQLYYHYYLRTSETSYLNEAFSFYSAIRQRSYYSQVSKEDRPELVVKKLRYYARYIVVCLLLNKMDLVKELVKDLSDEIEDYTHRFNTEDQLEWNLVLQEVAAFIEADPVMVLNDDNAVVITSNRLAEGGVPQLEQGMIVGQLTLADALIIGNCNNQVKFSELTIDMFRMLQALEREPVNLATQMNKPGTLESSEKPTKRENPHKYLLYKPTFSQLYTFLSASFKELPANSVLLIYLSATGIFPTGRSDYEGPYDFGGVLTNSNRDVLNGETVHKRNQSHKEMHCSSSRPVFLVMFAMASGQEGRPRLSPPTDSNSYWGVLAVTHLSKELRGGRRTNRAWVFKTNRWPLLKAGYD
ncbi:SCAI protein, partial [Polypterus senegalus]